MQSQAAPPRRRYREPLQSLYAVQIDDALLKLQTVITVTGQSESSLRRKMAKGEFPLPSYRAGARCVRWRAADVTNWLRAKAA